MQKTLAKDVDRAEIARRIGSLTPDAVRQWGAMSVGGMLCHLDDSYRIGLGEVVTPPVRVPLPRPVFKLMALRLPRPWPQGLQSVPRVVQGVGGTPPVAFEDDQARLLTTLERFCACPTLATSRHAFFGRMSANDWMRWGWLHADHHLRQFSA